MNSGSTNIVRSLQKLISLVVVLGMISFPAISTFSSLIDMDENFIELHDEKDSGEQEKLEENSKNEKKVLQVINLELNTLYNLKVPKNYSLQALKRDFILEIPIPPPDFV